MRYFIQFDINWIFLLFNVRRKRNVLLYIYKRFSEYAHDVGKSSPEDRRGGRGMKFFLQNKLLKIFVSRW